MLGSVIFRSYEWLDSPKTMLSFLQALVLHSIKVLSHFFKSHLNPNTRLLLKLLYKDFIFAKVRFVVLPRNGNTFCQKIPLLRFFNSRKNISEATKRSEIKPAIFLTFLLLLFLLDRTVLPRSLYRISFDETVIHAIFAVCNPMFELWNIYIYKIQDNTFKLSSN